MIIKIKTIDLNSNITYLEENYSESGFYIVTQHDTNTKVLVMVNKRSKTAIFLIDITNDHYFLEEIVIPENNKDKVEPVVLESTFLKSLAIMKGHVTNLKL